MLNSMAGSSDCLAEGSMCPVATKKIAADAAVSKPAAGAANKKKATAAKTEAGEPVEGAMAAVAPANDVPAKKKKAPAKKKPGAKKSAKAAPVVKIPKPSLAKALAKLADDDEDEDDGDDDADAEKGPAKKVRGAGGTLVIVESPAKAKTIKKYLGAGYTVKA